MINDVHHRCDCGKKITIKRDFYLDETDEDVEKLKDFTFFHVKCPKCGASIALVYPIIYVSDSKKFIVVLLTKDEDFYLFEQQIKDFKKKKYLIRIVKKDIFDFFDKIKVLDNQLNDVAVELMKADLMFKHLKLPYGTAKTMFTEKKENNEIGLMVYGPSMNEMFFNAKLDDYKQYPNDIGNDEVSILSVIAWFTGDKK